MRAQTMESDATVFHRRDTSIDGSRCAHTHTEKN